MEASSSMSKFSFPHLDSVPGLANSGSRGIHDEDFKPKLLCSLLGELVPDEKKPFTKPSVLSYVVNTIKTHGLLSDFEASDHNLKPAVDAWVSRLAALTSSPTPDKVWAAICLLGFTFQECSSERFLACYKQWFECIFTQIQTGSDLNFLRVASLASMSDLIIRLDEYSSEKKTGTTLGAKLVPPLLKLINEDASEPELEEAVCLLSEVIEVFPSSVGRNYDDIEASIFARFTSETGSLNLFKNFGRCLITLPKSRGTDQQWLLMMQKVILFLNDQLTFAFQGLEEEKNGNEILQLLVPPGREPPPPLGGLTESSGHSNLLIKGLEQVLFSKVPVPTSPIIALIKRVLMVDGSYPLSSNPMTITRHEFICSELPKLHSCSLDLLDTLLRVVQSHSLPHMAGVTWMLTNYIGNCSMTEPRIKVYSVLKAILLSMGIGVAILVVEAVITNTVADLDQRPAPVSVRIAALQVLDALLTVAGAVISDDQRQQVDHLLFTVAYNAFNGIPAKGEATSTCRDLQLAALRALLASLLSPGRARASASPSHLAQCLELYHNGTQMTGTSIAEYCQHALLALEAVIHRREPSLTDFQALADAYNGAGAQVHPDSNSGNTSSHGAPVEQASQTQSFDEMIEDWIATSDVPPQDIDHNQSLGEMVPEITQTDSDPGI